MEGGVCFLVSIQALCLLLVLLDCDEILPVMLCHALSEGESSRFYFEGQVCPLALLSSLPADLTLHITDNQPLRQPPSLLTQCLTSSPFTPGNSIQHQAHTPLVNPPRHLRRNGQDRNR